MWARLCAGVLLVGLLLAASRSEYLQAQQKSRAIDREQVKAGTRVPLTAAELNAYVAAELPKVAPPGVSRPSVKLIGNNKAAGSIQVDFVKLRTAQGKSPGWILGTLLEGQHEVDVTARTRSGGGTAVVELERVEVAGIPIQGSALDFLIRNYLVPHYPEAKVGQPFELHEHVDRIEVTPGTAYIVTR